MDRQIIKQETFLSHLVRLALYVCFPAKAQQRINVAKIAWLGTRSLVQMRGSEAELFFAEFSKLGYIGGKKHNNRVSLWCQPSP